MATTMNTFTPTTVKIFVNDEAKFQFAKDIFEQKLQTEVFQNLMNTITNVEDDTKDTSVNDVHDVVSDLIDQVVNEVDKEPDVPTTQNVDITEPVVNMLVDQETMNHEYDENDIYVDNKYVKDGYYVDIKIHLTPEDVG